MSKVNCPLMVVLANTEIFRSQNPELAEFMDSPEEQERFEKYFVDMVVSDQEQIDKIKDK